jgi:hypothetical protein
VAEEGASKVKVQVTVKPTSGTAVNTTKKITLKLT